mmetsp:Transcript_28663/g.42106  ORF Transcript_28663/g.42106 Transcript_28663/m.42106 type:complete len:341 (-) Transcript_28663:251-1273(-)
MTSAEQSFSKAGCLAALIITCFSSSSYNTQAFQSSSHAVQRGATISNYSPHTSALFADGGRGFGSSDNNNNNSGGNNNKKKGKKPKYTIEDKSYGSSSSSPSSPSAEMMINNQTPEEFFTTYNEWMPLFQEYKQHSLAHSFLTSDDNTQQPSDDTLWGISTLENRNPWRLLPSKPESPTPLSHLGTFLDEWQRSLLDIPIDTLTREEDIGKGNNDLHFLEEGRRVIAVTRFHVLDGNDYGSEEWEMELFRTCWSEMGKLMSENVEDTGSLVVLPNTATSLEYVQQFVQTKLVQPATWMGRSGDWEIVAMERGNLAVRLLYKLSAIPDLSEKYSPEDEEDE